jgi:hypothetical protein
LSRRVISCIIVTEQGHIVRNWKRRYCIVERGEIRYYSVYRSPTEENKFEQVLKGHLQLQGYSVAHENITGSSVARHNYIHTATKGPGHIILKSSRMLDKNLVLSLEHDLDWLLWSAALSLHINYANDCHTLRLNRTRATSMTLFGMRRGSSKDSISCASSSAGISPRDVKNSGATSPPDVAPVEQQSKARRKTIAAMPVSSQSESSHSAVLPVAAVPSSVSDTTTDSGRSFSVSNSILSPSRTQSTSTRSKLSFVDAYPVPNHQTSEDGMRQVLNAADAADRHEDTLLESRESKDFKQSVRINSSMRVESRDDSAINSKVITALRSAMHSPPSSSSSSSSKAGVSFALPAESRQRGNKSAPASVRERTDSELILLDDDEDENPDVLSPTADFSPEDDFDFSLIGDGDLNLGEKWTVGV